jgi:hypothetical protein
LCLQSNTSPFDKKQGVRGNRENVMHRKMHTLAIMVVVAGMFISPTRGKADNDEIADQARICNRTGQTQPG